MHRHRLVQIDRTLVAAVKTADPLGSDFLIRLRYRQQGFGVFFWILNAHTAMAKRTLAPREQVLVRRVMLIPRERVWKVEGDAAESVLFAGRLINADRTIVLALDF